VLSRQGWVSVLFAQHSDRSGMEGGMSHDMGIGGGDELRSLTNGMMGLWVTRCWLGVIVID